MLNLVIYLAFTIPLAYILVFKVQEYGFMTDTSVDTNNRGVSIWIAFVIGSGLQTLGYLIIIANTDWLEVSISSRRRLELSLSKQSTQDNDYQKQSDLEEITDQNERENKFA